MDRYRPTTQYIPALPYIPEASTGTLVALPGHKVRVVIAPWLGMAIDDVAWLHWAGSQHGGCVVRLKTLTAEMCGKPVEFLVDGRYVQANTYGSVQVSYLVDRARGPTLVSGCEIYSVPGLEPPSVDGVRRFRHDLPLMLPYVTPRSAVIVRVPPWASMCIDDQLIVSWRGQQPGSDFVQRVSIGAIQLGKEVLVHVPEAFLRRSLSRAQLIEVQYLLVPAHGEELASPACQPFLIGGLA